MKLFLKIWRQKDNKSKGAIVNYEIDNISPDMSFLEMMDVLNEEIISSGGDPVAFDHDCREGICGSCSMFINGEPHGPDKLITTCQLHMRKFKDGDTIYIEPFRAKSFPVIKDLVVDRSAFDRIQQAGGYISVNTSGILKMLIQFLLRKKMPIRLLMQQLVLVVELVLLPVKILLQCYLYQQKSHNFHYFLRARLRQLTES